MNEFDPDIDTTKLLPHQRNDIGARLKRSQQPLTEEEMNSIREHILGSNKSVFYPDLSDEALLRLIEEGFTQTLIAQRCGVAVSTISRRVAHLYSSSCLNLEQFVATNESINSMADPDRAAEIGKRLWDLKDGYEVNYARLVAAYEGSHRIADRIRAAAEIRKHLDSTQKNAIAIANSARVDIFVREVTTIFSQFEPQIQARVTAALQQQGGDSAVIARVLNRPTIDAPTEEPISI